MRAHKALGGALFSTLVAFMLQPAPAEADEGATCAEGICRVRMTADQLLANADQLVSQHRFAEAAPLLAALEQAPQLALEREFLQGYSAVEQGKLDEAVHLFRRILDAHPEQTRVRLELARALMLQGKTLNADHHFRLAQQDQKLPDEVSNMVRATRGVLRNRRNWTFNVDLGLAPDSNITNGTSADTVNINLGPFVLPLTLDEAAKSKSGTGQFTNVSASARFGFVGESRLLVEGNGQLTNYSGKAYDDIGTELAVGPEMDLNDSTILTVQAVGSQRWHGGQSAATGYGLRAGIQHELSDSKRIGFTLDARRSDSGFSSAYSGWQMGAYATYEQVVGRRFIASATLFGRRGALQSASYSDVEVGGTLGIGGELPLGLNAAVSAGASRALFDAPLSLFSADPRKDWRLNASAQLGLRSLRILGFSPSIAYSYSASLSSLTLYDSKRSRLRFALARYF